jgi:hypothetical protein
MVTAPLIDIAENANERYLIFFLAMLSIHGLQVQALMI